MIQTYEYDMAGMLSRLEEHGKCWGAALAVVECRYESAHRLVNNRDVHGRCPFNEISQQ